MEEPGNEIGDPSSVVQQDEDWSRALPPAGYELIDGWHRMWRNLRHQLWGGEHGWGIAKVVLVKMYDEYHNGGQRRWPTRTRGKLPRQAVECVRTLWAEMQARYPQLGGEQLPPDDVIHYVAAAMPEVSFRHSSTDSLGLMYQAVAGDWIRDNGVFLTPARCAQALAAMCLAAIPSERMLDTRVIDPACGSGALLHAWVGEMTAASRLDAGERASYVTHKVAGLDISQELTRIACTRLSIEQGGRAGIYQANSVMPKSWSREVQKRVQWGQYDLVLGNPPFVNRRLLDEAYTEFELPRWQAEGPPLKRPRNCPMEVLFLEVYVRLARPGAILGLILPATMCASNQRSGYGWHWLMQKAEVLAEVELPPHTFAPYTKVTTKLYILQVKGGADEERVKLPGGTMRATVAGVGHDLKGKRTTPDNDLPQIVAEWRRQLALAQSYH